MEKDLVSIILPVWKPNINRLKTCIDSLVNQTYSKREIIIVYKKSEKHDEEFYDLIEKYQDKTIKLVNDENKGFPASLNQGIESSTGEFIARIDGDDYCEINRLEKQLEFKRNHKCNILGSWAYYVSDEGKKIGKKELPTTHKEIRKKLMHRNPLLHSSVLMDKSMLDKIGFYDVTFTSAEDYELWFRAMFNQYKFGNVPEYLVNIGLSSDSITRGSGWKKVRISSMSAKKRALLRYGFSTPRDIFYYLLTPFYYLISPKNAMKARKILNQNYSFRK